LAILLKNFEEDDKETEKDIESDKKISKFFNSMKMFAFKILIKLKLKKMRIDTKKSSDEDSLAS
jgi:hypothetical protein